MENNYYIYKYCYCSNIIYIGKTIRPLFQRINEHKKEEKFMQFCDKEKIKYDDIPVYYVRTKTKSEMDALEIILINQFKPILNEVHKNPGRGHNVEAVINEEWKKYTEIEVITYEKPQRNPRENAYHPPRIESTQKLPRKIDHSKRLVRIDGKTYCVREFDFNAACELATLGYDIFNGDSAPVLVRMRAIAAWVLQKSEEEAGEIIVKHITNGGTLEAISEAFNYALETSGFLCGLRDATV